MDTRNMTDRELLVRANTQLEDLIKKVDHMGGRIDAMKETDNQHELKIADNTTSINHLKEDVKEHKKDHARASARTLSIVLGLAGALSMAINALWDYLKGLAGR